MYCYYFVLQSPMQETTVKVEYLKHCGLGFEIQACSNGYTSAYVPVIKCTTGHCGVSLATKARPARLRSTVQHEGLIPSYTPQMASITATHLNDVIG